MSTIKTGTTLTTAYQVEGDTTGALVIQTGASPTTAVTIGSDQSTTLAGTLNLASQNMTPYTGFKNRLINSDMRIDQRNAGASINNDTSGGQFAVDRWNLFGQQSAKFSAQQSTTAPAGFKNSLAFTSLSAYTPLTGDRFIVRHKVEGYNMADLNWGTANAQTVTFSFWVRSSLTGVFGGTLMNDTQGRCFPFTYTVNATNTWEQKTITVAGDTSGTWETGNLTGLQIWFSLGAGATYVAPSFGSWIAGNYTAPPTAQSLVATSGATLYITGVQLEKGSTATSFDYRPYGTELSLCQRYYQLLDIGYTITTAPEFYAKSGLTFVLMRATPTIDTAKSTLNSATFNVASTGWQQTSAANTTSFGAIAVSAEL